MYKLSINLLLLDNFHRNHLLGFSIIVTVHNHQVISSDLGWEIITSLEEAVKECKGISVHKLFKFFKLSNLAKGLYYLTRAHHR